MSEKQIKPNNYAALNEDEDVFQKKNYSLLLRLKCKATRVYCSRNHLKSPPYHPGLKDLSKSDAKIHKKVRIYKYKQTECDKKKSVMIDTFLPTMFRRRKYRDIRQKAINTDRRRALILMTEARSVGRTNFQRYLPFIEARRAIFSDLLKTSQVENGLDCALCNKTINDPLSDQNEHATRLLCNHIYHTYCLYRATTNQPHINPCVLCIYD
jgi:hypothetical protein